MLWGCRSEEVKDDSKLERRRWTEDRLLSFSGEGRNPWALLPFFFLLSHCFYLLRSFHHPFPLSPLLSLPPSLALWDNFKVKPFGQSASCKDLHHCFPFLSLLACVCNLSSVRARVSELTPHRATHAHTPTLTAIKLQAEWFSRTPYTRLGGRKRCALVVVVCVSSASTNWQASHCSSCIFNVSDVLWYFCLARGSSARRYMEMQRLNSTVTV